MSVKNDFPDITLRVLSLYPKEMNIYGDQGNLLAINKRCQWRGIKTKFINHEVGKELATNIDIVIGGGGQDSGQNGVQEDLKKISAALHNMVDNGVPMLVICGMYQLFGHYFITKNDRRINGIGVFDAWTKAGPNRLIGNISIETEYGVIVGYENHSGLTYLNKRQSPFGQVLKGAGNNGSDNSEGARTNNVFGSYLHGPILPKNPVLVDELIRIALKNRGLDTALSKIDDSVAYKARDVASRRPR